MCRGSSPGPVRTGADPAPHEQRRRADRGKPCREIGSASWLRRGLSWTANSRMTLRRSPVRQLPVDGKLAPTPHCMSGGGELVEKPRAERQRRHHDLPRSNSRSGSRGADPALYEQRRRADREAPCRGTAYAPSFAEVQLPARFAREPFLHYMNSGGERIEERRAEGGRVHHDFAEVQAGPQTPGRRSGEARPTALTSSGQVDGLTAGLQLASAPGTPVTSRESPRHPRRMIRPGHVLKLPPFNRAGRDRADRARLAPTAANSKSAFLAALSCILGTVSGALHKQPPRQLPAR